MIRRKASKKYMVTLFKQAVAQSMKVVTYVGYKGMSVHSDSAPVVKTPSDIVTVEVKLPAQMKPSLDTFETPSLSPYLRTLLGDGYRVIAWSEIK